MPLTLNYGTRVPLFFIDRVSSIIPTITIFIGPILRMNSSPWVFEQNFLWLFSGLVPTFPFISFHFVHSLAFRMSGLLLVRFICKQHLLIQLSFLTECSIDNMMVFIPFLSGVWCLKLFINACKQRTERFVICRIFLHE